MNDLELLHDAWPTPDSPSPAAMAGARAVLLTRATSESAAPVADRALRRAATVDRPARPATATGRVRRPPVRRRRAVLVGAAALAVALIVVANLGPTGPDGRSRGVVPGLPSVPVAAAEVLERAAVAAEDRPFTPPRDDQWIYVEERLSSTDGSEPRVSRKWRRADGRGFAFVDDRGELRVEIMPTQPPERRVPGVLDGYRQLAALTADPDALLRWGYDRARDVTGAGLTEHGDVYAIFRGALTDNVLPPKLEAALFRALKRIPGVTARTVEIFGGRAISLGLTEDWLRQELLLDPRTYAVRGRRSTVARDAVIDPLKAGNETGEVRKGSRVISERLATAIVDEPGERR
jgi:hypothetical protein